MPEKGVLCMNEREVRWEERKLTRAERLQDPDMFGKFIAHPTCCADAIERHTFSLHVSSPADLEFVPLRPAPPDAAGTYTCPACDRTYPAESTGGEPGLDFSTNATTSNEEYVNNLHIEGRISAKARGKELLLGISNPKTNRNFLIRVGFALEGHCFWIPTSWYHTIVGQPPVERGKKSFAFPVPDEFVDGPLGGRIISIQAAFIRPKYTLIFVDHNVMIQFHVMQIRTSPEGNMVPGSPIWDLVWNSKHGPVYHQEPEATLAALAQWREETRHRKSSITIFAAIKAAQTAFNGSGAQEATDILLSALIHPQMPASQVCSSDIAWGRLLDAVKRHDKSRIELVLPGSGLPCVSGSAPFRMKTDAHGRYLTHISTYRRREVTFTAEMLEKAHELGLFIPNARGCRKVGDGTYADLDIK
ncbi:hypothetical protein C8R46DRAFT_1187422 [Mycena filopes]|nr:hypothetical protein C8R46DRAFT_1187422 [Mycena filopes]